VIGELDTGDFTRIRLGVAPPDGMPPAGEWVDHVLGPFAGDEMEMVARVADLAAEAVEVVIGKGVSQAMGRFNRWPVED
jgi:PTH1 family peptidyl-tRNA hydrolase